MIPNYLQSGYIAERVLSASPLELIRLLYEGAMSSVDLAIEMLHANDIMARGRAISKAMDILGELHASLREGPNSEFTSTLGELYGYMRHRLIEAHTQKSEAPLLEIARLLKSLYESWLGVMKCVADATPVGEIQVDGPIIAAANPYEMGLGSPGSGRSWQI